MTDQVSQEISEVFRARLEEAGLAMAVELFPADVKAAVATAIQVRESFEHLQGTAST